MVKQTLTQGECLTFRPHLASQRKRKKKKGRLFQQVNHAEVIGVPLERCTQTLMASGRHLAVWLSR